MSADFEIRGADEFYRLSKALKAAARTGLRRELNAAMRRAAKPLTRVAKDAAAEVFPKGGGLAEREGKIPFRAVTRTGSRSTAGLRIQAPGRYVAGKTTNASGRFRHPVFADGTKVRKEWTWVDQEISGSQGWFDQAMQSSAPLVRPELEKAINNVVDQILKGAR